MSLITKDHLSLVLKALKKLLSFKADKTEVILKSDVSNSAQIETLIETDMLPAVHDANGAILTDEKGNIILRY